MTDIVSQSLFGKSFNLSLDNSSETVTIVDKLASTKSPIFTCKSNKRNKFAVKVSPYQESYPSTLFLNESRYSFLQHPNINSIKHSVEKYQITTVNSKSVYCSLLFMELACCDLRDLLTSVRLDEKLARTLFHQLVEGVSYLHSKGVAHMDLKLENLLIGSDYNLSNKKKHLEVIYELKLADFDFSYKKGDLVLQGCGTENFRAPEVAENVCRLPEQADIFSLGIILFCLVFGHIPYSESEKIRNYDLFDLAMNNTDAYWRALRQIRGTSPISEDFKELFMSMISKDPSNRASLADIKNNSWYKKPVYDSKSLEAILKSQLPKNHQNI